MTDKNSTKSDPIAAAQQAEEAGIALIDSLQAQLDALTTSQDTQRSAVVDQLAAAHERFGADRARRQHEDAVLAARKAFQEAGEAFEPARTVYVDATAAWRALVTEVTAKTVTAVEAAEQATALHAQLHGAWQQMALLDPAEAGPEPQLNFAALPQVRPDESAYGLLHLAVGQDPELSVRLDRLVGRRPVIGFRRE